MTGLPPDDSPDLGEAKGGGDDGAMPVTDVTPDDEPDGAAPAGPDMGLADLAQGIVVGGTARVTADSLNLRTGAGTQNMIIDVMPCGTRVDVVGGPDMGWWNVKYN